MMMCTQLIREQTPLTCVDVCTSGWEIHDELLLSVIWISLSYVDMHVAHGGGGSAFRVPLICIVVCIDINIDVH